jgi:hypothetical protein
MIVLSLAGAVAMAVEETEFERIVRELDILRARYALFQKCATAMRIVFAVGIPLSLAALAMLLLPTLRADPLYGGFVLALPVMIIGLMAWISWRPSPGGRMIDFVSMFGRFHGFAWTGALSEADGIEQMIAAREQRLAELGAGK